MKQDLILDLEQLEPFVKTAEQAGAFVFDVETVGEYRKVPKVNEVTWMSMATEGRTVVIPLGHPNGNTLISKATRRKNKETGLFVHYPAVYSPPPEQLDRQEVFDFLRPLFFNPEITKIAHNAPFDLLSVAKYFGEKYPCGPYGDTLVAGWLLDENRQKGLKPLTNSIYGLDYDSESVGKSVEIHPFWKVARYAWLDSRMEWLFWKRFRPQLKADEKLEYIWQLEMGVLECLLHMQSNGINVDVEAMKELREELRKEIVDVEERVYRTAGTVFNLGSTQQKQEVLYGPDYCKLKPTKLTDGGVKKKRASKPLTYEDYSTDEESLKAHIGHPVVDAILDFQELSKIKGTYLDGYLGTEDKPSIIFDGKVYPTFVQYGARTGRFSGREPNLQNIPARGNVGKKIRYFFGPPGVDWVLLDADYGQCELRILAHYCRDGLLYEGFMNGIDAHTTAAAAVFGVAPEDVESWMRDLAKTLAFAISYDAQEELVAKKMGRSVQEARKILKKHEQEFPEIYEFKERLFKTACAREVPHIRTLLGRYRRLPDLRSPVRWKQSAARRQLLNSVCQGGNADLIKLAMVRLNKNRPSWLKILVTLHDELLCAVPRSKVEEGAEILRWAMVGEGIHEILRVPLVTDVKVCERWSDAKG